MSCYVKTKGVYYPMSEEQIEKLECLKLPENFHIEALDDGKKINYYMSYELRCEYDTTSDDFGRNRFLTEKEQSKYVPMFEQVVGNVDPSKLKCLEYSYYNCCEPIDYYVVDDDFMAEI